MTPITFVTSYGEISGSYGALFAYTVLVAFAISLVVLTMLLLPESPSGQKLQRSYLGSRLATTRLYQMLQRHHVTPAGYINNTSVGDIRKHLQVCRDCSKQAECDDALKYDGLRQQSYAFCPNRSAIEQQMRTRVSE